MLKFLLLCSATTLLFAKEFVINVDINRTIIALDSHQNYNYEDLIALSLAKTTYLCWDERVQTPISYYDYVYDYLLPGEQSDQVLRKKRRSKIHHFLEDIRDLPCYEALQTTFDQVMEKMETIQDAPFPSFLKFMDYLKDKDVHLVFRTFGKDFEKLGLEFETPVQYGKFIEGALHFGGEIYHEPSEWHQIFTSSRYFMIQDDFPYWHSHDEHASFGKPFIAINSDECTSLFFDDNIVPNGEMERSIVMPFGASSKELIDQGQLIPVDTLQAIMDDDYFINHFLSEKLHP
ncbi:MAG: hypothetical protein SP1CHLAM54_17040 [Chlamydiia bacterium]|nr:hypothetical protein [Chlamydiia bacterium]MCH9616592.1 hypothetical protein [Chlamydiia bacterium]MCH9629322.1 hypothetical protein [Chlamydiia bacterium]